tara:strand:- start:513 stop:779 length:267 start_codon:yes stop_codon:yes gene_type:complete
MIDFTYELEDWENDDEGLKWYLLLRLERLIQTSSYDHEAREEMLKEADDMGIENIATLLSKVRANQLDPIKEIGLYSKTEAAKRAANS